MQTEGTPYSNGSGIESSSGRRVKFADEKECALASPMNDSAGPQTLPKDTNTHNHKRHRYKNHKHKHDGNENHENSSSSPDDTKVPDSTEKPRSPCLPVSAPIAALAEDIDGPLLESSEHMSRSLLHERLSLLTAKETTERTAVEVSALEEAGRLVAPLLAAERAERAQSRAQQRPTKSPGGSGHSPSPAEVPVLGARVEGKDLATDKAKPTRPERGPLVRMLLKHAWMLIAVVLFIVFGRRMVPRLKHSM